jgi:cyanophycin synthetase
VGEAIVDHLFPNHEDGRIPVVGITGSHGKTTVAHIIAHLLALSGRHTGLACSDGFYLDRRQVFSGDHAKWKAANNMLTNRSVEAAVLENGGDSILCEGLAYDGCQIGVVTNVELERHYGRHDIQTPRQVFDVLRTQVDVVLPTGAAVLNARELLLVEMAGLCNGEVIYFSADPESPVISAHREHGTSGLGSVRGTRAVIVRDNEILLADGSNETPVAALAEIALGNHVDARTEVENILAGVAAAWAFGIAPALIRQGIKDFYHARADARAIAETNKTGQQNPALELTC